MFALQSKFLPPNFRKNNIFPLKCLVLFIKILPFKSKHFFTLNGTHHTCMPKSISQTGICNPSICLSVSKCFFVFFFVQNVFCWYCFFNEIFALFSKQGSCSSITFSQTSRGQFKRKENRKLKCENFTLLLLLSEKSYSN